MSSICILDPCFVWDWMNVGILDHPLAKLHGVGSISIISNLGTTFEIIVWRDLYNHFHDDTTPNNMVQPPESHSQLF